jgi:hypothetical protein
MKSDAFVSVVLVVDKAPHTSFEAVAGIQEHVDARYSDYEILMIVLGPIREPISGLAEDSITRRLPSIRYIQLATRVDGDVAWAAGLENAIGDFVVLFDHEADPVSAIADVIDACKSGFDVVVGVADQALTIPYRIFRALADRLLGAVDYHLPRNATSLRCLSRRAVNTVTRTGRFHHQLHMRIQKTGYPSCTYDYKLAQSSAGKKSLARGVRDFIQLLVFNSSRPLRWMSMLGFVGSLAAAIFAAYSVLIHAVTGNVVEGWTTTILFMSILFMLQFVMMAFFGEYLGRLLDDRSEQADYSIVFEQNSSVMVNPDRVNVLTESTSSDRNLVQTGRNQ